MKPILIKGGGVAGLVTAFSLHRAGYKVAVCAPQEAPQNSASWFAGGMLAPFCEKESAPIEVQEWGLESLAWWKQHFNALIKTTGTLVLAPARDKNELVHFASRTQGHIMVNGTQIAEMEPDLAGRFSSGLFYKEEAYTNPRQLLLAIKTLLQKEKIPFFLPKNCEKQDNGALASHNSCGAEDAPLGAENWSFVIDATGISYKKYDKNLRGVRGEMILVETNEISLSHNIRFLHPRIPLYIVPRENNLFMIGATMIESDFSGAISARSMLEFLSSAYALHPAFSESRIVESSSGVRPAYADNLPHISQNDRHICLNGFYRHGFLLAPKMAQEILKIIQEKGKKGENFS